MKLFNILLLCGLVGLPFTAFCQDSYAWNPANWDVSYRTEYFGNEHVVNWSSDNQQQTLDFFWAGFEYAPGARNTSGQNHTVSMDCSGTIRRTIKWIGQGPPPSQVLVKLTSVASYAYYLDGAGEADNGLGSIVNVTTQGDFTIGTCTGSQYRWVSINQNGEGSVELTKHAFASSSGSNSSANAHSQGFGLEIDPRAVVIDPWVSPTYGCGASDIPFVLPNPDPTDIQMNVGVETVLENVRYKVDGYWIARLWGNWIAPVWQWQWTDILENAPFMARVARDYTNQQVADIARNGPIVLTNLVTVTDTDYVQRTAKVKLSIYAQRQWPNITRVSTIRDPWTRVSPMAHRSPYGSTTVRDEVAYSKSITKAVLLGGGQIQLGEGDPLKLALNIPSYEYGETASVTHSYTISYEIAAGPDDVLLYIEKRNFWIEETGTHYMYGNNGYQGLGTHLYRHWASATKEQAEQIDREYRLQVVPIPE